MLENYRVATQLMTYVALNSIELISYECSLISMRISYQLFLFKSYLN
jgi:hypothetical protein